MYESLPTCAFLDVWDGVVMPVCVVVCAWQVTEDGLHFGGDYAKAQVSVTAGVTAVRYRHRW